MREENSSLVVTQMRRQSDRREAKLVLRIYKIYFRVSLKLFHLFQIKKLGAKDKTQTERGKTTTTTTTTATSTTISRGY